MILVGTRCTTDVKADGRFSFHLIAPFSCKYQMLPSGHWSPCKSLRTTGMADTELELSSSWCHNTVASSANTRGWLCAASARPACLQVHFQTVNSAPDLAILIQHRSYRETDQVQDHTRRSTETYWSTSTRTSCKGSSIFEKTRSVPTQFLRSETVIVLRPSVSCWHCKSKHCHGTNTTFLTHAVHGETRVWP